ncbi:enoyl-CoA hydratase-related protein [Actinomycetospora sp. CA-101289]|uniref:enoyl-CoA hydratase-related protein n=1 Tax=Actinomycetospora sp. CA-101289 TaxID=3239893 RepID=UPI003D96B03C
MPSQREEVVRRLYDALAAGDAQAATELLHPDFVGETTEGLPFDLGGTHRGPVAMTEEFWWRIGRHYRARAEARDFLALADGGLLVLGRYTGSARDGGGALDAAFAHVLTFDGDRVRSLRQYTDSARWRQALPPAPAGRRELRVVQYEVLDGVATIELDRPEAGNAIDPTMVEDLDEATFRITADASVRAVLVRGAGGTLSVGGDLPFFARTAAEDVPQRLRAMTDRYHLTLERLATLEVPVVCAVQGAAAGGGMGLAHVADLVVAADTSTFVFGYGAIGLASDGANSWYLPRLVGTRRAQQLFLLNRRLTGTEALAWGLVTEVVPHDEVLARADELAATLAAGPTGAYGRMKRLLRQSASADLADQLAAETREMAGSGASEDSREGITAFVERRRPAFRGR